MPRARKPVSSTHEALTSSINPNWRTPQPLYDVLHREFQFGIDMSANALDHKAPLWCGPGSPLGIEDALCGIPWHEIAASVGATALFDNPPFCAKAPIGPWVEQMALAGEHVTMVGVIPFSPQTRWWRTFIWGTLYRAHEIRRFPHRLKFDPPPDYVGDAPGANVNTVIVIWRPVSSLYLEPWVPIERYWDPLFMPRAGDEE